MSNYAEDLKEMLMELVKRGLICKNLATGEWYVKSDVIEECDFDE